MDKQQIKLSPHFKRGEFNKENLPKIRLKKSLVNKLENLRVKTGPISVTSGFRSKERNKKAGGAKGSFHLTGEAADIKTRLGQRKTGQAARKEGFWVKDDYKDHHVHVDVGDRLKRRKTE